MKKDARIQLIDLFNEQCKGKKLFLKSEKLTAEGIIEKIRFSSRGMIIQVDSSDIVEIACDYLPAFANPRWTEERGYFVHQKNKDGFKFWANFGELTIE